MTGVFRIAAVSAVLAGAAVALTDGPQPAGRGVGAPARLEAAAPIPARCERQAWPYGAALCGEPDGRPAGRTVRTIGFERDGASGTAYAAAETGVRLR